MGTYEQGRDRQHLASLYAAIDDFITRYNANPSTERRRTIFLFPGGMGSQLMRATTDSSGWSVVLLRRDLAQLQLT
jgi:hypothetical protein